MVDVVFRGGLIVDGTGRPVYEGDVAVEGDRVVAAGRVPAREAAREIPLAGRVLAPGFVDLHSHADLIHPLEDPLRSRLLEGRIRQGITTEIVGNCGLGVFPVDAASASLLRGVNSWMTPAVFPWNWQNAGDYLSLLEGHRPLLNVGVLQPHGPLRMGVLGLRPGAPGPKALDAMRRQLAEALDAGAFGLSTGLIYPPGMFSDTEELAELARVVARWDAVYTSHIRGSSETLLPAVEELLEVGRRSGARVHHSHNEAVGPSHWRRIPEVLEREEAALRQGVSISFDMFPYPAAATTMLALYPPWALEGGPEHLLRRLREPETRRRIQRDMEHLVPEWPTWREGAWPHNLVCAVGWKNIRVASVASDKNRLFENQSLAEVARRRGQSPFDAVSDLMLEERGQMGQFVFAVSGDDSREEFLELLARHPLGAFCTDANDYGKGKPHPGAYGAFPRVLARFVREKRVLTLEEAIHKMTSYPADLFRIPRRGRIEVGCFADLVVLEPEGVRDRASFENPRAFAEGILQVWINGVPVVDNSRYLGIPAGRVLRKSGGSC